MGHLVTWGLDVVTPGLLACHFWSHHVLAPCEKEALELNLASGLGNMSLWTRACNPGMRPVTR